MNSRKVEKIPEVRSVKVPEKGGRMAGLSIGAAQRGQGQTG